MRIAQIVLAGASEYEKKCQRVDHAAFAERHEVVVTTLQDLRSVNAGLAHIYASAELPRSEFVGFPLPYVASGGLRSARWSLRRPAEPSFVVSPLPGERHRLAPEAVEQSYFGRPSLPARSDERKVIATFERRDVRPMIEQTFSRIERFRDDVTWTLFDRVPAVEDLLRVDAWVDPAVRDDDLDGFVAEALVAGIPVVATRTPLNVLRLEKGRTGWLVPRRDPNELTHAILAALFKPEMAESKRQAARQTSSKFHPRQRARALTALYQTLIP